ncbi:MAG: MFS transporter [Bacteroidales bacterium]|nr:MFS transporter [Bacteroidales bacterium]
MKKGLLRDSAGARWLVLACLVVPMFASYFFDDMFSTLSHIFQNPEALALGWNSQDYGFYAGGYSFLCVWGGLIVCGMLLDKWGVKITGSIFVAMMVFGAALVTYGISEGFASSSLAAWMSGFVAKPSLLVAYTGCMLFGLGSEIAGVAVTRSIAKWFKGHEMAFAMGLQLAIARLGTALALVASPLLAIATLPDDAGIVYPFAQTIRPALFGMLLMLIGIILWALFVTMDARSDRETGEKDKFERSEEDKFRFSDIVKVLANKHFILISLLCVFFYCCIISFKKFATSILIPRFDLPVESAKWVVSMIPFFTVVFTPLFGSLVDRIGKGTKWMIVGSALVLFSHLVITFAPAGVHFWGYFAISMLGVGYALVPAAMWQSVPKIVPEKNLGTAYSLIYWFQNIGMMLVPIFVGRIFKNEAAEALSAAVHAEFIFIGLGILAIVVALMLAKSSANHPELKLDVPNKKS